jgi:hypothetical protein
MLKVMDDTVCFFDGAEFVGYWRSAPLVRVGTPGVYASVYRGKNRAVIVVVSDRREDLDVPFELGADLLPGRKVQRIYDGETGFPMTMHYDYALKQYRLGEFKAACFGMPDRGVRLLVVE